MVITHDTAKMAVDYDRQGTAQYKQLLTMVDMVQCIINGPGPWLTQ